MTSLTLLDIAAVCSLFPRKAKGGRTMTGAGTAPAQPDPRSLAELKLRTAMGSSAAFRAFVGEELEPPAIQAPELQGLSIVLPALSLPLADEVTRRLVFEARTARKRRRTAGERIGVGDWLVVDAAGFHDGLLVPFSVSAGLKLGWGRESALARRLRDALVGATLPVAVTRPVVLPDDFPLREARGRTAVFTLRIQEAFEVPELALESKEALPAIGRGDTLAVAARAIAKEMMAERREARQRQAEALLLSELLARTRMDLPETLLDREIGRRWSQVEGEVLLGLEVGADDRERSLLTWMTRPEVRAEARSRLASYLVLSAIAAAHGISVAREQVDEACRVREEAKGGGTLSPGERKVVAAAALFARVIEFAGARARVVEEGRSRPRTG